MKKASEYRRHASECRRLSDGVSGDLREQLLRMAATWEQLAHERCELVRRHPELAIEDELEDEALRSP